MHYFTNLQIAELLRNVAAALQLSGEDQNRFRIIAYNRAADTIEHASSDVKDLWDNHQLDALAGIGPSIISYLDELFRFGKVKHFDQIIKKYPPAFYELLKIPQIGVKTASKLCQEIGLSKKNGCLAKLKKAARAGRVPEHLVQNILNYESKAKRLLLHQATAIAEDLVKYLQACPQVLDCQPLGSLRRQATTIGDLDLAVSTFVPAAVIQYFCAYPKKQQVLDAGNTKASILLRDGLRVDLMTSDPSSFGSLLQHLTGSKHHNISLREYANSLGYSMSEYGVKSLKDGKQYSFADEKSLYNFIRLDYIPPELREATNEIQLAKTHNLPSLVELSDIKGDLHLHSSFDTKTSHDLGQSSVIDLINKAKQLKYEYIGLTEHNPSLSNHSTKKIYSILKQKQDIIHKNIQNNLYIFNGLEIDIKPDGRRAISDDCLALLDYAIVSIHSSFRQSRKLITDRLIAGLSHPKAKILGHPTGRLLQQREGIDIDWDRLFDFCQKNHKILEIDAWPNRLDLPDTLVHEAVQHGIKLVINSDSHSLDHMEYIRYGVAVARRGFAQKSDIINTLNLKFLKEVLLS